MKKIMVMFSFVLAIITSAIIASALNNSDSNNTINSNKKIAKNNFYTILIETDVGSGEYVESTSDEWPSGDYVLNEKLSGCKNGSEISFDEENKIVYVSALSSDSCYVYFNKGSLFSNYIKELYTSDGINDLYLHDGLGTYGTLEASDNSYRYSGPNPNNYVCFGTDANPCPVDNLYRIIGVFDNNVKLIKYDYATSDSLGIDGDYYGTNRTPDSNYYNGLQNTIAEYGWNNLNYSATNEATGYYNVWKYSYLNTLNLNNNFINYLGKEWSNKIILAQWYNGGLSSQIGINNSVKTVYDYELGINKIILSPFEPINTKIGLMYLSDYGYAASPSNWNTNLGNYNNSNIINNNWIFIGFYDWTITRNNSSSTSAFYITTTGNVTSSSSITGTSRAAIRPTFYLNDNVTYVSGDGSIDNPYRIN